MGGEHIAAAAERAVELAKENREPVRFTFNGIELVATAETRPACLVKIYKDETARRHDAYVKSPAYAKAQREAKERDERKRATLAGALPQCPEHMSLKDPAAWESWVKANQDPYGKACVEYAELWARLMEGRMAHGDTVEGCAEETSRVADVDGITAFMYGCAVGMLSKAWKRGEALRRWHNLKTQIKDEGEKANAEGGVLNPALLSIG
jgi:hypothetical protein